MIALAVFYELSQICLQGWCAWVNLKVNLSLSLLTVTIELEPTEYFLMLFSSVWSQLAKIFSQRRQEIFHFIVLASTFVFEKFDGLMGDREIPTIYKDVN